MVLFVCLPVHDLAIQQCCVHKYNQNLSNAPSGSHCAVTRLHSIWHWRGTSHASWCQQLPIQCQSYQSSWPNYYGGFIGKIELTSFLFLQYLALMITVTLTPFVFQLLESCAQSLNQTNRKTTILMRDRQMSIKDQLSNARKMNTLQSKNINIRIVQCKNSHHQTAHIVTIKESHFEGTRNYPQLLEIQFQFLSKRLANLLYLLQSLHTIFLFYLPQFYETVPLSLIC